MHVFMYIYNYKVDSPKKKKGWLMWLNHVVSYDNWPRQINSYANPFNYSIYWILY